ncbi:glycosyltransferase family 4 protein [Stieleria varia]|uniref:Putative glycosyl transferase n=1 Tax=Stieleria varia TaxID=2528005 RepID=A0A5C6B381_9BACT|nr:glycosyltransferase family 4 protein [Stieleria varia]TWU05972.1 putative glycosyl transferase [Stieleria varia]
MNTLPRIVFLNRSYWPDVEATGQLLTDLCEQLALSFDVHVICGQPNTPTQGTDFEKQERTCRAGVTIHRLQHYQFPKRFSAARIINLVSFYRAAKRYLKQSQLTADVIVTETDPFLLPLAGDAATSKSTAKHVCYLQDIYPDVAEAVGKSKIPGVASTLRRLLRNAYRRADRVIVLGECMRDRLIRQPWGLSGDKIDVIPNWADCDAIEPIPHHRNSFRQNQNLDGRFVVMHSGNMGLTQRLDVLLRAAAHECWPAEAKLLLVGGGASEQSLRELAPTLLSPEQLNDRIAFLPYRKRSELAESLSAADLHVVSMHENIGGCLCPSKLYGILAAGRPVLAIANEQTDLCRTVEQHDLGWCCTPGNPAEIAAQVNRAINEQCAERNDRAREIAISQFDRDVIVHKFRVLLGELTNHPKSTPQTLSPLPTPSTSAQVRQPF